jgi:hypothetical protein
MLLEKTGGNLYQYRIVDYEDLRALEVVSFTNTIESEFVSSLQAVYLTSLRRSFAASAGPREIYRVGSCRIYHGIVVDWDTRFFTCSCSLISQRNFLFILVIICQTNLQQ